MTTPVLPDAGTTEDLGHVGNPSKHAAVTLGADVDLTALLGRACVAIWVGTSSGGNLTVQDAHGTSATYKNVPQGSYVVGVFTKIVNSTTTVSDLVAVGK